MTLLDKLCDFGMRSVDLWRSEEMQLAQLIIPAESAHDTIAALGDVGLLQFEDMNPGKSAFQRTYANQVRRCDAMARMLRFFEDHLHRADRPAPSARPAEETRAHDFDDLEAHLGELERELREVNANTERLQRTHGELVELRMVLEKAGAFLDNARPRLQDPEEADSASTSSEAPPPREQEPDMASKVGNVTGTILADRVAAFERLLFRATRGNMVLRHTPMGKLADPATLPHDAAGGSGGDALLEVDKVVFLVFFAGAAAREKVGRICSAYGANRYPFPEEGVRQREMHAKVSARLAELHATIQAGELRRDAVLQVVAAHQDEWTTLVHRELAVYHTLNKLSVGASHRLLLAQAWLPTSARGRIAEALRAAAGASSTHQLSAVMQPLVTQLTPPTLFQTNRFTACFQSIVEAYGVARYREVNPTVLTFMTFPFLFAVMFGDVGHALLLLAVAAILLAREARMLRADLGDMLGMLFAGRYLLLLMALFSLYTGILYNEFFSMPLAVFGATKWQCQAPTTGDNLGVSDLRACTAQGGVVGWGNHTQPYAVGVDPLWHGCTTELQFVNSMKMKMSIIMGIVHMNAGLLMSCLNNVFFRDYVSLIFEYIPQFIFLNSIFGYLCFMIVYKWVSGSLADLYNVLIYMFLSPGTIKASGNLFTGQAALQVVLLCMAVAAVPCMLFPKPFILRKRAKALAKIQGEVELSPLRAGMPDSTESKFSSFRGAGSGSAVAVHQFEGGGGAGGGAHGAHGGPDFFDFSEVMVHQLIHTIEFVLGSVSNTASYLRLWALSLAHSQLSAVFYDRLLLAAIRGGNVFYIFVGCFVFWCATFAVLMVMESLSAFLHALRLHWVEYQNKFYRGDGYLFAPFDFKARESDEDTKEG